MPKLNVLVPVVEAPPKRFPAGCPELAPKGFCCWPCGCAWKLKGCAKVPPWFPPNRFDEDPDGCAGVALWFPPNEGGAGEPLIPLRAALAFEALKLGFLILRPPGVVVLDVLDPPVKANGFETSWLLLAVGAAGGAALVLFSPNVKLLLTGCCEDAPNVNGALDEGPPKLLEPGWLDPKLKLIPVVDGVF